MITPIIILISISTAVRADQICLADLGCFSSFIALLTPLAPVLIPAPYSLEKINTRFFLYTRNSPGYQVIKATDVSMIRDSSFDPDKPIKFIIHGYRTGDDVTWPSAVAQDIIEVEDVNCFTVYWGDGPVVRYEQAVSNARVVGAQVAMFLASSLVMYGRSSFLVHIIGHSLGAHIAGFAGQKAHPRVNRISALDPAGPLFEGAKNDQKLDPSDAELVDVIYTDTADLTSFPKLIGLGTNDVSGHLNFYPNGGRNQPGCAQTPSLNILDTSQFINAISCSHSRSVELFRESIHNYGAFQGHPAASYEDFLNGAGVRCEGRCVRMGYHLDFSPSTTGKFYLRTKDSPPFSVDSE